MRVGLVVVVCGLVGLAGCSGGVLGGLDGAPGGASAGARLTGAVHGGQQPIVGAHVYLFAASATGYGGAGIAASSGNASVSLLTSAGNTALDSSGGATNGDYYVTTDASGGFSISGDYTCAAGAQVYLYALGGNPGAGVNSAAGLMAVLGSCPVAGNFASATPFVMVNEVSTIAAAYAMAGFATDATHVGSSGTQLALTGIANAFANAGNLVTLSRGAALATTPAGNGTVPQAEINTLGNVLAACVNSNGAGSTACSTLFANAMSGGSSGTAAGDTAAAAINMAHNPGVNIAGLYALASGTPPFAPGLSAQPNDWTVGLNFARIGGLDYPHGVAIDNSGNAWVTNGNSASGVNSGLGSVTEFSSSGAILSGPNGYIGGGLDYPRGIAIDLSGNVWVANSGTNGGVTELTDSGSPAAGSPFSGGGLITSNAVSIDGIGSVWVANQYSDSSYSGLGGVAELSSSGAILSGANGFVGGNVANPTGVAIDGSGDAWIADFFSSTYHSVTKLSSSGSPISLLGNVLTTNSYAIAIDGSGNAWIVASSGGFTILSNSGSLVAQPLNNGALYQPTSIAIDGSGNAWVGIYNGINNYSPNGYVAEVSSSGSVLTGLRGYVGGGLEDVVAVAVDGSGDLWTANSDANTVTELIGIAAPVITPIVAGLPATPTADGSSRLGTRP